MASQSENYFSGSDEQRLEDLQQQLDDEEIKAILFARGGYGIGRIIDSINFKNFRKNPKWLIGFSDVTILHAHIYTKYDIATMHAPMAAAFNVEKYDHASIQSLRKTIEGRKIRYVTKPHEFNRKGRRSVNWSGEIFR